MISSVVDKDPIIIRILHKMENIFLFAIASPNIDSRKAMTGHFKNIRTRGVGCVWGVFFGLLFSQPALGQATNAPLQPAACRVGV